MLAYIYTTMCVYLRPKGILQGFQCARSVGQPRVQQVRDPHQREWLPSGLVKLSVHSLHRNCQLKLAGEPQKALPVCFPGATPKCLYHSLCLIPSSEMNPRSNDASFWLTTLTLLAALMKSHSGPLMRDLQISASEVIESVTDDSNDSVPNLRGS